MATVGVMPYWGVSHMNHSPSVFPTTSTTMSSPTPAPITQSHSPFWFGTQTPPVSSSTTPSSSSFPFTCPEPRIRVAKRSRTVAELDDVVSIKRQCTQPSTSFSEQLPPRGGNPTLFDSNYPLSLYDDNRQTTQYHQQQQQQQQEQQQQYLFPSVANNNNYYNHSNSPQTTTSNSLIISPTSTQNNTTVFIEDRYPSPPHSIPSLRSILIPTTSPAAILQTSEPSTSLNYCSAIIPYQNMHSNLQHQHQHQQQQQQFDLLSWRRSQLLFQSHVEEVPSDEEDDGNSCTSNVNNLDYDYDNQNSAAIIVTEIENDDLMDV